VDLKPMTPEQFVVQWTSMDLGRAWAREADFLEDVALHQQISVVRSDGDQPVVTAAQAVTSSLAPTLGVAPLVGRWIAPEDQRPGATPVAVLSHARWREWFTEDRAALGRSIELNQVRYTVIGVLPPAFRFPRVGASDMWIALPDDNTINGMDITSVSVIGRLQKDVGLGEARERATRLSEGLGVIDSRYPDWTLHVKPHDEWRANPDVHQALWTLAAAVVLMWLIAVGNGVNLLSVRAAARTREIALRMSLGASRLRVLRQLLTESCTLALMSGVLAMALAAASLAALTGLIPSSVVSLSANQIDIGDRVIGFAFVLSALTGLLVGLLPALGLVRARGSTSVSAMDLHLASRPGKTGVRRSLIVAEVALSMTLLAGTGLVINSFNRLLRVEPGFEEENLIYISLSLPGYSYESTAAREDFFERAEQRLEAVPGVQGVTVADGLPPSTSFTFGVEVVAEGEAAPEAGQPFWIPFSNVRPDYFELLGIPLVAGRTFDATDDANTRTVIIDVDMAEFLWGSRSPLGKRFRIEEDADWYTVVGVVGDVKLMGLDDRRGTYEVYRPLTDIRGYMSLAVRTSLDPEQVMPPIRAAVWELDADQPITRLETATDAMAESVDGPRFLVTLLTIAAGIALALVAIGVYGVLSFAVTQRTRELGVRVALGAQTSALQHMVLRDGLLLTGVGVAIGLGGAVGLSRVIRSLLFNVEPTDPATLMVVAGVMMATAMVACYFPARRATKVDPMVVLRAE
jgi:putative ABC transport system permease protein